jgi:serine/threonine protein kinase
MMTLTGNKKLEHHKRKRDMDDAMQYPKYGGKTSGYGGGGGGPHGGSNVISREEKKTNDTMKHYQSDDDDGPLEGHLAVAVGDVLGNRFTVQKLAGEGTFGKVYRCSDAKHSDEVAIKVIRKIDRYISSAKIEAKILKQLYYMQEHSEWQPNVIMYTHFYHLGHYCMVFEPLGKSLLDYVESNKYQGFPKHMVKEVTYQLLSALEFLHRNSMVRILFYLSCFFVTSLSLSIDILLLACTL